MRVHAPHQQFFSQRPQNPLTQHPVLPGVSPFPTADVEAVVRKKKVRSKNRRVHKRKNEKVVNRKLKLIGINSAGLSSKLDSFDKVLEDIQPGVFFIQESKMKRMGKINTENAKKYQIYELLRKSEAGGGLALGVLNDLKPVWVGEGCGKTETLSVEITVQNFKIRCVNAYGPQENDPVERKTNFWSQLDSEVASAANYGSGLII